MSFSTWGAFNVWSGGVVIQPPTVILSGGSLIVVNGGTYTPPTVQVISYDGSTLTATPDGTPDVDTNGTYVITYTSEPDTQGQTGTAQWVVQVVDESYFDSSLVKIPTALPIAASAVTARPISAKRMA